MDNNQKINCTVTSSKFNNGQRQLCQLESIIVEPCQNCNNGKPADESMCGSYQMKNNQ